MTSTLGHLHHTQKTLQTKLKDVMVLMISTYRHCFSFSWDNGDTEKMSPWDMEPIPDDGTQYTHTAANTCLNYISSQM